MRGQKGGLRDWLVTNKIINLNIQKRKQDDDDNVKQKTKEATELKKVNQLIEGRKTNSKVPIKARSIINLRTMKKGAAVDPSILNNVVIATQSEINSIGYDEGAKEVNVMTLEEVKVIQKHIKSGIDRTKKEVVIIKKVNTIIDKAKSEINAIKEEVISIEKAIVNEYDTKRLGEYERKLLQIQTKIENLKRRYSIICDNSDFYNFDELNDEALLDEISNYKFITNSSELVTDLAKCCKRELNKMSTMMDITDKKINVDRDMEKKKKELVERDDEFATHKKEVLTVDKINSQIQENIERQKEFIRNLEHKLDKTEDCYADEVHIQGLGAMSYNLYKISFLIYAMKHKKIGLAFGALLFENVTRGMRNSFVAKQKQMAYLEYKQLNKQLYSQKDSLEYINGLLNDSLSQIKKLKEEFNYKFRKYQDVLPEYYTISKKLDSIINQLSAKTEQVKKEEEKVEKKYEKNKMKIKRMEGA